MDCYGSRLAGLRSRCEVVNRRRFLLTSLAGAVLQPLVAGAQKAGGTATIGVLTTTRLTEPLQKAIREGLAEHGYFEGQNVVIEIR
jgi:hypothetical protein